MTPIVMINFSRSGGTLLARILGADPGIVLVSDVNPLVGATPKHEGCDPVFALKEQMQQWYDIQLSASSFVECVIELRARCRDDNKQLIIRDWTHHDFVPSSYNEWRPSGRFSILTSLGDAVSLRSFAFVRNAIDVYLSSSVKLPLFSLSYLRYAESLVESGMPVFKFEELLESPDAFVDKLCGALGFSYSMDRIDSYVSNLNVTGDLQSGDQSRGIRARSIKRLPRKWVGSSRRQQIDRCPEIQTANGLLEYGQQYDNATVETFLEMLRRKAVSRWIGLRRWLRF